MGHAWLYQSLISGAAAITVSTAAEGSVGTVVAANLGSAEMLVQGPYTGDDDRKLEIMIDSIAAGAEVGQATFKWRWVGDNEWRASGIATSSGLVALNDTGGGGLDGGGVSVKWVSGTGDDFYLDSDHADYWRIACVRMFGRAALAAKSPNREWRAGGAFHEYIIVDLGADPDQVDVAILGHHNLSDTATVTLMADDAANWAAPAYSQVVAITETHLIVTPAKTYRYWRWDLQNSLNPAGFVRAGLLYLGGAFIPSKMFMQGSTETDEASRTDSSAGGLPTGGQTTGIAAGTAMNYQRMGSTDLAGFRAMFRAAHDTANLDVKPVWFWPDTTDPESLIYGLLPSQLKRTKKQGTVDLGLSITELPRLLS